MPDSNRCEDCLGPIEEERLQVLPDTKVCIKCAFKSVQPPRRKSGPDWADGPSLEEEEK